MTEYSSHSIDGETKLKLQKIAVELGLDEKATVPAAIRAIIRYYEREEGKKKGSES